MMFAKCTAFAGFGVDCGQSETSVEMKSKQHSLKNRLDLITVFRMGTVHRSVLESKPEVI